MHDAGREHCVGRYSAPLESKLLCFFSFDVLHFLGFQFAAQKNILFSGFSVMFKIVLIKTIKTRN
jgi:hypothetical protein